MKHISKAVAVAGFLIAGIVPSQGLPLSKFAFGCVLDGGELHRACDWTVLEVDLEILQAALQTSVGGLTEQALQQAAAAQERWEHFAALVCLDPDLKRPDENPDQCLQSLIDQRVAVLEHSRMLGGLRFYVVSDFSALPDGDAEGTEYWRTARHEVNTVRIDPDQHLSRPFNDFMQEIEAQYLMLRTSGDGSMLEDPYSDSALTIAPFTSGPNRISLSVDLSWIGHGAAHGEYRVEHVHYMPELGRELEAGDLFAGETWEQRLAQQVFDEVYRTGYGLREWIGSPNDLIDLVVQPRRWRFEDDDLVVQFQIYELGPYAGGAPAIRLPRSALEPILAAGAGAYF